MSDIDFRPAFKVGDRIRIKPLAFPDNTAPELEKYRCEMVEIVQIIVEDYPVACAGYHYLASIEGEQITLFEDELGE